MSRDHPRIRGEHSFPEWPATKSEGSSPHTRGARFDVPVDLTVGGIIPAYAGSTRPPTRPSAGRADHPRIRGEHKWDEFLLMSRLGSSPHTRGAPDAIDADLTEMRIIPAYAGSTSSHPTCELPRMDHPRIRGEHRDGKNPVLRGDGSSPHTRGAHSRSDPLGGARGIIPAYAGSTRRS